MQKPFQAVVLEVVVSILLRKLKIQAGDTVRPR
jgi:hypothetical protein